MIILPLVVLMFSLVEPISVLACSILPTLVYLAHCRNIRDLSVLESIDQCIVSLDNNVWQ